MFNSNRYGAVDKNMMKNISHDVNGDDGIRTIVLEELQRSTAEEQDRALKTINLMELVVQSDNLEAAYKRVNANKGAPGIDNMNTTQLKAWMVDNEQQLINQLLNGIYQPMPVKRVSIPKPDGGTRHLGIPTVKDRLIQQAILQILTPIIDPEFSEFSYGFRPNRSAHQAVLKAREYVNEGKDIVVDIDLEKFFDTVNHDMLMARVARRIKDKRILKLIRKFLQSGIMINGICIAGEQGTPQGGPLSPLLSNILLDDLDKELERRKHSFCRYADDCNIYVRSMNAGTRVMESVTQFLEGRLKLKVNREKSSVSPSKLQEVPGL